MTTTKSGTEPRQEHGDDWGAWYESLDSMTVGQLLAELPTALQRLDDATERLGDALSDARTVGHRLRHLLAERDLEARPA